MAQAALSARSKQDWLGSRLARREALIGYLFISPWLIGFTVFLAGPILASLFLSFTQYKPGLSPIWVGFANYARMFGDDLFYHSLRVTSLYTLISVPLGSSRALASPCCSTRNAWATLLSHCLLHAFIDFGRGGGHRVRVDLQHSLMAS